MARARPAGCASLAAHGVVTQGSLMFLPGNCCAHPGQVPAWWCNLVPNRVGNARQRWVDDYDAAHSSRPNVVYFRTLSSRLCRLVQFATPQPVRAYAVRIANNILLNVWLVRTALEGRADEGHPRQSGPPPWFCPHQLVCVSWHARPLPQAALVAQQRSRPC